MSQIQKKFIAANAIDGTKIRLLNNETLRARNAADSADINILKVNASDRIEFSSVPQSTSDASAANDLVRFSQLGTLVEGLKPKAAVRVATVVAGTLATDFEAGDVVDTVTLVVGDRILIKDQAAPEENGIYIVSATGAPVRAADFNNITEIPGSYTIAQFGSAGNVGTLFVSLSTPATLDVDAIQFTARAAISYTGGDMVTVTGNSIAVDLHAVSGLESSNPGNAAGQLRNKVHAATVKINASNELEGLKPKSEVITLTAGMITAQAVDLAKPVYSTDSLTLCPVGGCPQILGTDFSASLTGGAGGVTQIAFLGDLATAGAAALVAGDKLIVGYSFLT